MSCSFSRVRKYNFSTMARYKARGSADYQMTLFLYKALQTHFGMSVGWISISDGWRKSLRSFAEIIARKNYPKTEVIRYATEHRKNSLLLAIYETMAQY